MGLTVVASMNSPNIKPITSIGTPARPCLSIYHHHVRPYRTAARSAFDPLNQLRSTRERPTLRRAREEIWTVSALPNEQRWILSWLSRRYPKLWREAYLSATVPSPAGGPPIPPIPPPSCLINWSMSLYTVCVVRSYRVDGTYMG